MAKLYQLKVSVADLKYCGPEPQWDGSEIDDSDYQLQTIRAFNWYNYVCTSVDRKHFAQDWIRILNNDPKAVGAINRSREGELNSTVCHLMRMNLLGYTLCESQQEMIANFISELILKNPAVGRKKPAALKQESQPTVCKNPAARSENLAAQAKDLVEDTIIECLHSGDNGVSAAQAISICEKNKSALTSLQAFVQYKKQNFEQLLDERKQSIDSELQESYENVPTKNIKTVINWLESLLGLIEKYHVKKAKDRKPKQVDPARLVEKLVYLKSYPELGLVSVDPRQCIGADEIWTYCTKTRKLAYYLPVTGQKLSIKSNKLINVDPTASCQKTLKKPKNQLNDFAHTGKRKLQSWFAQLPTTAHRTRPKFNNQTIILRVSKI